MVEGGAERDGGVAGAGDASLPSAGSATSAAASGDPLHPRAPAGGVASIERGWAGLRRRPLLALGYSALVFGGLAALAALNQLLVGLDLRAAWVPVSVACRLSALVVLLGLSRAAVNAARPGQVSSAWPGWRGLWRATVVLGLVSGLSGALALPFSAPHAAWYALLPVKALCQLVIATRLLLVVDLDAPAATALSGAWRLLRGRRVVVVVLALACLVLWVGLGFGLSMAAQLARGLVQTPAVRDGDFLGTAYAIGFGLAAGLSLRADGLLVRAGGRVRVRGGRGGARGRAGASARAGPCGGSPS